MCYITSKDETIKIADRDIVVYKLLDFWYGGYKSSFYGSFLYEEGKEYETSIEKDSYDLAPFDSHDTQYIAENIPYQDRVSYGSGFHSCELKERLQVLWDDSRIGEFIIPKGAEYMYRDGLYISNRIRFVGVFTPTE